MPVGLGTLLEIQRKEARDAVTFVQHQHERGIVTDFRQSTRWGKTDEGSQSNVYSQRRKQPRENQDSNTRGPTEHYSICSLVHT